MWLARQSNNPSWEDTVAYFRPHCIYWTSFKTSGSWLTSHLLWFCSRANFRPHRRCLSKSRPNWWKLWLSFITLHLCNCGSGLWHSLKKAFKTSKRTEVSKTHRKSAQIKRSNHSIPVFPPLASVVVVVEEEVADVKTSEPCQLLLCPVNEDSLKIYFPETWIMAKSCALTASLQW